jgi:hypothetical protein
MRALTVVLAMACPHFSFADDPIKKEPPKPLPDSIVKAWKDAGAIVGWVQVETNGSVTYLEKPEPGAIPAFRMAKWKEGVVAKLPAPEAPFGLDLSGTEIKDGGLKELASLKSLSALCVCDTKVSDAAVEELQKALPKCVIFHC